MFKEERERNHVNELDDPHHNGGIINNLAPRIYVKNGNSYEEYIA